MILYMYNSEMEKPNGIKKVKVFLKKNHALSYYTQLLLLLLLLLLILLLLLLLLLYLRDKIQRNTLINTYYKKLKI